MLSSLKVEAGQGHQTSYASNNTSCPKSPLCDMRSRRPNHRANEHQSHAISSVRPHPNTVSVPFFATPLVNKYWHSFRGPRHYRTDKTVKSDLNRLMLLVDETQNPIAAQGYTRYPLGVGWHSQGAILHY